LEIELGIILEVVHLSSTTIMEERINGLSQEVWLSALYQRHSRLDILTEMFGLVLFTLDAAAWVKNQAGIPPVTSCHYQRWDLDWRPANSFNRLTFWMPPPEIAAQLLFSLLQLYVEKPLTNTMLILIPRILQRCWTRLSRFILEVGVYP
jgi:hypothetical protein